MKPIRPRRLDFSALSATAQLRLMAGISVVILLVQIVIVVIDAVRH